MDARPGHLLDDRERDRPGAGAEVDDAHGLLCPANADARGLFDRPPGQHFRLRTRDEDARADLEVDEPERGGAGEVLQRHPTGAGLHQLEVRAVL
jgi:hypothetical protein